LEDEKYYCKLGNEEIEAKIVEADSVFVCMFPVMTGKHIIQHILIRESQ